MKASILRLTGAALLTMFVAACGGGGGGGAVAGGTGGTGISSGEVTAIGSVTVNGVTYSCDGAVIRDDDGTVDQGSGDTCVSANASGGLEPGMVVTIDGTANPPRATTVRIRPRARGPIASIDVPNSSFVVMGQTVIVDADTKFKLNGSRSTGSAGLNALTLQMIVQVNGFPANNGAILATFIQTKTPPVSGEFEVKGVVDVTNGVVTLGNLTINAGTFTSPALVDGLCVELKGSLNGSQLNLVRAPKADDDCDGLGNNLAFAEVEGIVNSFTSSTAEFKVGEQRVILGSSLVERDGTVAEDLVDGAKVEVEGSVSGGLLTASKITFKRSVRIQATLDSADTVNSTASTMGITITWDSATRVDNTPAAGQRFEIRGRKSGPTQVHATRIRQSGGNTDTELRGPVDANPAPALPNFTILGVQVRTNQSTDFESIGGGATTQSAFFSALQANDVVKAKGSRPSGNIIDAREVEFEND